MFVHVHACLSTRLQVRMPICLQECVCVRLWMDPFHKDVTGPYQGYITDMCFSRLVFK